MFWILLGSTMTSFHFDCGRIIAICELSCVLEAALLHSVFAFTSAISSKEKKSRKVKTSLRCWETAACVEFPAALSMLSHVQHCILGLSRLLIALQLI